MIDVPQPSSGDGLGKYLPWIASVCVALVAALWGAFRGKDAKLVAALEAQLLAKAVELKAKDDVIKERDTTIVGLGVKLDKERLAASEEYKALSDLRSNDQMRMVRALLVARNPESKSDGYEEAPTGVRTMLDILAPSDPPHDGDPFPGGPPRERRRGR